MKFYRDYKPQFELDYKDVFIVPQFSELKSRKEADTSVKICDGLKLDVPIISANMSTVGESEMCIAMYKSGAIGAMHRFMTIEKNVEEYQKVLDAESDCFVSLGVNEESKLRAIKLIEVGAKYFIIDIAHGNSAIMKDKIKWLRDNFGNRIVIMAGNVATPDGVDNLHKWGADIVKVGVGPGCFAAGTRILLANGTYKNIEDVCSGDKVINKNGEVAVVKNAFCTGERDVISYRTNVGIGSTYCTPDHQHWIGDISTNNSIGSSGYKKVLDKQSKTTPKKSKYKWKEICACFDNNSVLLLPKNINFELPETFQIALKKRVGGNYKSSIKYENYVTLRPSYELGYIFGTFLGDGTAHCIKQKNGSNIGSVIWYFGKKEQDIADKLNNCIITIFGRSASSIKQVKNTIQVRFSDKPFADFLNQFGKKDKKNLPKNLFVNNEEYIKGMFEGLIDSDGTISSDGRIGFCNTSKELLELFSVITYKLYKHFPNIQPKEKSVGKLNGASFEKLKDSFVCRPLINPNNRLTNDYQVVKLLEKTDIVNKVKVYDLEIDDDTHSFIANNVIVHNSVCLTKNQTGVTMPQFQAVLECAKYANIPIVADGGIKEYGDVCKALGLGASAVMAGGLFAGLLETPGEVDENGNKPYYGMASKTAMKLIKREEDMATPEGKEIAVKASSRSAGEIVKEIKGALQSSMSYTNAKTLKEFEEKIIFGIRNI